MSDDLKPYRVEWRPNLVTPWLQVSDSNSHDEARDIAANFGAMYEFAYTRVVSQHVIETNDPTGRRRGGRSAAH